MDLMVDVAATTVLFLTIVTLDVGRTTSAARLKIHESMVISMFFEKELAKKEAATSERLSSPRWKNLINRNALKFRRDYGG